MPGGRRDSSPEWEKAITYNYVFLSTEILGMEDKSGEFLPCSQKASQGEPLLIRPYGHDSQSGKNVNIPMLQRKIC